jgi:hypothetical protein
MHIRFPVLTAAVLVSASLFGPAFAQTTNRQQTTYANDATNNLPNQVNALHSEVTALQGQVATLQNANMEQNGAIRPNSSQQSFNGENSSILPGRGGR